MAKTSELNEILRLAEGNTFTGSGVPCECGDGSILRYGDGNDVWVEACAVCGGSGFLGDSVAL